MIGAWKEYTGPLRHAGAYFGINDGDPNFVCAPHTISLVGPSISVSALCNAPIINTFLWTSLCIGCGHADTGTFEYSATLDFTASVAGTCNVHWDVDISGKLTAGPVYSGASCAASGMFGSTDAWLETYQSGVLVDSQFRKAYSTYPNPTVHTVDSVNISRHLNVGESVQYLFQIFAMSPLYSPQYVAAVFSFTPDP